MKVQLGHSFTVHNDNNNDHGYTCSGANGFQWPGIRLLNNRSCSCRRTSGKQGRRRPRAPSRVWVRFLVSNVADSSGGLHLIFSAQPKHTVHIPRTVPDSDRPADIRFLIQWMKKNLVSEREDMFVDGDGV